MYQKTWPDVAMVVCSQKARYNMKVILIDDNHNAYEAYGDEVIFMSDGRDGSPMFVECECHHMINRNYVRYDIDNIPICPICD